MSVQDTAVGAILEIPDGLLTKIKQAESHIKSLGETSEKVAREVSNHWGQIAPDGLQKFIDKIALAQEAMKSLGGSTTDVKFNTESATQQMSNFTEKVQSDSSRISQSIQDLASIPIDAKGIKEWAESSNKTFNDVLGMIKGLKNGLREMATESPNTQGQLQAIKAWEDYYKSVSKVNEEKGKMARKTADIERAISNVRAQIDHERQAIERAQEKSRQLTVEIENWKNLNPTFKFRGAELELDRLREKYNSLLERLHAAPASEKSGIQQQIESTKKEFQTLDRQLVEYRRLMLAKYEADEKASASSEANAKTLADLQKRYDSLNQDLNKARAAQASFNAELEKGNTAKSLASEYAKLTKRLQEVNDAMNKFQSAGGNVNTASYKALENELMSIMARRKEIEKLDIAEVNQYRQQMNQSAYQQDLSAWIQNEAQKTAKSREEAEKRLAKYRESLQSYTGAMRQADAILDGGNSRHLATNLENIKRAINDLKSASGKLNLFDPSDVVKAEQIKKKIAELTQLLNRYKDATNVPKEIISPQQAMNMAKNASTLRQLEAAYKALKDAMATTNPKSKEWQEMNTQLQQTKTHIDEIKKKMGEFQSQSRQTSNVMGQLQSRIAAAFSVGAIMGFIKKMTEVRAQFELQRVALGAIIQDRDEANKIFTQVQNMALESPFNIMQLEKATKQIAAFGFETKKLVPTMKMFADISAGLGVEIDRLVLVMGHLKARNFLEGTMVRQFTNMGFNVLGELSKYYTELEGKMVSVGEVQDRVKKKMVSFEDVEEVLKRVTSAGGMFYDMQKKQSDSLWGQMQRIQDAYDLMLNEIGQSNEGILKGALTTIRNLINSWRSLKPIIVATVAAMGTFGASMILLRGIPMIVANITNGINMMGTALGFATKQQLALNAAQKANAWGALIAGITAATVAVIQWITTQDKLTESMDRVRSEGMGNMYDLIYQYQKLADTVKDYTMPYEERKKALEELHRIYGDILPSEMLEIKNILQMKDGYEEVTEAIKAYSEEKTKANLKAEVENIQGKEIGENGKDLAEDFADWLDSAEKLAENMPKDTFRAAAETIITEISEEVKNGKIPIEKAIDELQKRMIERFRNLIPKSTIENMFKDFKNPSYMWAPTFDGLTDSWTKYVNEIKGIDIGLEGVLQTGEVKAQREEFENLRKSVNDYNTAIANIKDIDFDALGGLKQDEKGHILNITTNIMDMAAINTVNAAIDDLNAKGKELDDTFTFAADNISQALQSDADMSVAVSDNIQNTLIATLDMLIATAKDPAVKKFFENLRNEIAQTKLTPIQEDVKNTMDLVAKKAGISKNVLDKLKLEGIKSYADVKKKSKSLSDEAAENIKRIAATRVELMLLGLTAAKAQEKAEEMWGNGKSEEELKKEQKFWEEVFKTFGGYENSKNKSSKGSDKELKRWQDLKKAIEDVSTAYDKYRKSFTVEESNKRIEELLGQTFKELGSDIKQFYKDGKYDAESMIKALEVLKGMTNATTKEREKFRSEIERKIGTTQVEVEVKMKDDAERKLKQELDDMFASYELSKELKKLGLSVDLVFMFGGEPLDLNDLRAKVTKKFKDAGGDKASENDIKEYKDRLKKIEELELKERKERVKEYHKYFVKTVGERARIELEYLKKMDDVRKMYEFTDAQRQDALRQLTEEKNKKLSEQIWKDFKGGEVYQMMFQDLNAMSEKTLVTMREELERIKSSFKDLNPHDLKEINKAIQDIDNQIANRNPFKALGSSFKDLIKFGKERKKLEKEYQDAIKLSGKLMDEITEKETQLSELRKKSSLYKAQQIQSEIDNLKEQIAEIEKDEITEEEQIKIDALNEQIRLLEEKKRVLQEIAAANQSEEASMLNQINGLEAEVGQLNNQLAQTKAQGAKAGAALSQGSAKASMMKNAFNQIKQAAEETVSHLDGIIKGLDRMGMLTDEAKDNWESFKDGFEAVNDIAEGGINVISGFFSGNYADMVNGTLQGIKGTINLIASIFEIGDKKNERMINDLKDSVEDLDRAFKKLEKAIEDAYNFEQYNSAFKSAEKNLQQQKKYYEEMLALEQDKKKSDKDKQKEYEDKIDELAEKERDLRKKFYEDMGSTTEYRSVAEDFVSVWLDAFKETGDGLDALNENWDEFIQDMFIKQAALAKAGEVYKDVIDIINNAMDEGKSGFDLQEAIAQARTAAENGNEYLNEYLKALAEVFGIKPGGSGELILSDLQKGIQNITEPQAAAIEAYLNSMRFAVFTHTEQLERLIATVQAQYGSGADNPVVTELKGIRVVLDNMDRRWASVINTQGRNASLRISAD